MACSGFGAFGSDVLSRTGEVELEGERFEEVQFEPMEDISDVTVELSARTWNVVLEVLEIKLAWTIGPPGRLELFGSPYYERLE